MLGVNASLIRFWENEIPTLKPQTIRGTNIRRYVEKDIEHLKVVYNLVKVRGFKISAAKKMLHANREGVDKKADVLEKLTCKGRIESIEETVGLSDIKKQPSFRYERMAVFVLFIWNPFVVYFKHFEIVIFAASFFVSCLLHSTRPDVFAPSPLLLYSI